MFSPKTPSKPKLTPSGKRISVAETINQRGIPFYGDLELAGRGLYIIVPSHSLDHVKLGLARSLNHRMDSYCGYYIHGYKILALLKVVGNRSSLEKAEKDWFDALAKRGYPRVEAICGNRIKDTEWIKVGRGKRNIKKFENAAYDAAREIRYGLKQYADFFENKIDFNNERSLESSKRRLSVGPQKLVYH